MDEYGDDLAITESHLPEQRTSLECPNTDCPAPWLWIILVIVLILVLLGFVAWIIYLYHRNSENKGGNIELLNPLIRVDSDSQISATFVTNCNNTVTLFATLHPPQFTNAGSLSNANAAAHTQTSGSLACTSGATGASGSITLSGLQPGVKYYATLIATNSSKSSNYKSYTQVVFLESGTFTPTFDAALGVTGPLFEIQDILQVGAVQINNENADQTFGTIFNQRPIVPRSLFFFNGISQLQATTETAFGSETICLFNVNGSLVGANCASGPTGSNMATSGTVNANSQWIYNPSGFSANKLCLKNSVSTTAGATGPVCLKLTGIGNGNGALSVTSDTDAGDAWVLAFESLT